MAKKTKRYTDPYVQLLSLSHTSKGVWVARPSWRRVLCYPSRKGKGNMFNWFKKVMLIASVYSLSLGLLYYWIDTFERDTEVSLTNSAWLALPITILIIFIWSKISKKFSL